MPSTEQQIEHILERILKVIIERSDAIYQLNCELLHVAKKSLDEQEETTAAIIANGRILQEIADGLKAEPLTTSIANIFTGDSPMANNELIFNVGQTSTDTITPFLADGVTPSGGAVSNVVVTFSDPSATFVVNGDNTVTFTAVAASAGAVSGSTAATITDTDGAESQWTQPFTVTTIDVTPPPPEQLTQSIANVFSTPV